MSALEAHRDIIICNCYLYLFSQQDDLSLCLHVFGWKTGDVHNLILEVELHQEKVVICSLLLIYDTNVSSKHHIDVILTYDELIISKF